MKQEPEFFGEQELDLVYIAKKLREALLLEERLTAAGIDYAVEVDEYRGGFIFQTLRKGAFLYVQNADLERARQIVLDAGLKPPST
ncbi:MAG: hypothetical protein K2X03_12480 [Bryobacteraceae bacterium]|nr:hypothetical protein [Bryobacteraceae bacterium]